MQEAPNARAPGLSIWWLAFGYFACYVPYTALTKSSTEGWLVPGNRADGSAMPFIRC